MNVSFITSNLSDDNHKTRLTYFCGRESNTYLEVFDLGILSGNQKEEPMHYGEISSIWIYHRQYGENT